MQPQNNASLYTQTHRHRHIHTQTCTHMHTHTHIHTYTHTDIHTHPHNYLGEVRLPRYDASAWVENVCVLSLSKLTSLTHYQISNACWVLDKAGFK